jgi:hypothetical protein
MAGRTLLQQAVPTTFGLKAAGWLLAVVEARERLQGVRLPAQLGGAAGTLAALGERGPEVLSLLAAELGLDEPVLPWHAHRRPVTDLFSALDAVAAACAKIGLDVVLLAQTEVREVAEPAGGGSSTMPQKHNTVRSTVARACACGVHAGDRADRGARARGAAGAWHAEWPAPSEALALTAGASAAMHACLRSLRVFPGACSRSLRASPRSRPFARSRAGRAQARLAVAAFASDDPRAALAAHWTRPSSRLLDPVRSIAPPVLVDRASRRNDVNSRIGSTAPTPLRFSCSSAPRHDDRACYSSRVHGRLRAPARPARPRPIARRSGSRWRTSVAPH